MELEELVLFGGEHGAKVRGRKTGGGRREAGLMCGWKWIKKAAWWRLMVLCWVLIECNIEGSGLAEGDLDFFLGLCLVALFAEGDIVLTGYRNF